MADEWLMAVQGGLSAHFICRDGKSRPGTHWTIGLKQGDKIYTAMVKGILADDASAATRANQDYQSHTVRGYLHDRLAQGWHPDQQEEHTNPDQHLRVNALARLSSRGAGGWQLGLRHVSLRHVRLDTWVALNRVAVR